MDRAYESSQNFQKDRYRIPVFWQNIYIRSRSMGNICKCKQSFRTLHKSNNLQYNTVGRWDNGMIVQPSDGPMFIGNNSVKKYIDDLSLEHFKLIFT